MSPQEIFQRYIHAGAMSRDPERVAALFAEDGVYEAPFAREGDVFPPRWSGRTAIRDGLAAAYQRMPPIEPVDTERTRFTLHLTADPDVFVAEIDTVFVSGATMSLVQIFRLRDGLIHQLRDYFV